MFVTQQLLDMPDVGTALEQVCGKRSAQAVAAGGLSDTGCPDCPLNNLLQRTHCDRPAALVRRLKQKRLARSAAHEFSQHIALRF
jgi:hypothetical protein